MYKQMAYVHMYISGDAAEVVMQALKWCTVSEKLSQAPETITTKKMDFKRGTLSVFQTHQLNTCGLWQV